MFAFEGFVYRASCELETEPRFASRKRRDRQEPDVVVRLKLLRDELGLDTSLQQESGEDVFRRHFRLRNKWAHDLGMLTEDDPNVPLASIVCWRSPGEQAWVSNQGWSELRRAVENLAPRILELVAHRPGN